MATAKVYPWNDRTRRSSLCRIGITHEALRSNGWLEAA